MKKFVVFSAFLFIMSLANGQSLRERIENLEDARDEREYIEALKAIDALEKTRSDLENARFERDINELKKAQDEASRLYYENNSYPNQTSVTKKTASHLSSNANVTGLIFDNWFFWILSAAALYILKNLFNHKTPTTQQSRDVPSKITATTAPPATKLASSTTIRNTDSNINVSSQGSNVLNDTKSPLSSEEKLRKKSNAAKTKKAIKNSESFLKSGGYTCTKLHNIDCVIFDNNEAAIITVNGDYVLYKSSSYMSESANHYASHGNLLEMGQLRTIKSRGAPKVTLVCPNCSKACKAPKNMHIEIICPSCKHHWVAST